MNLVPAEPQCRNHICRGVRLREHILDFHAGINVPFGNVVLTHRLEMLLREQLCRIALTDDLHDFE